MNLSDWRPVISDEAFAYLAVQRGKESDLLGDRAAWEDAYRSNLIELYRNIAPHLPIACRSIMDVGAGVAGIDALLYRHFGACAVCLVDGRSDAPVVRRHAETFSNFKVARDFLAANGVKSRDVRMPGASLMRPMADLVVSFAAWCFHFPPSKYLHQIKREMRSGATVILDVRKDRPEWRDDLDAAFGDGNCICEGQKFERLVFHVT